MSFQLHGGEFLGAPRRCLLCFAPVCRGLRLLTGAWVFGVLIGTVFVINYLRCDWEHASSKSNALSAGTLTRWSKPASAKAGTLARCR